MTNYADLDKRLRDDARLLESNGSDGYGANHFDMERVKLITEAADALAKAREWDRLRAQDIIRLGQEVGALTRELEEAKAERIEANNQWRLDYNEMAGNAELFQEDVISILRHYAPRRSLLDLSGQRIADFLCRYAPALAAEHDLSREARGEDDTL